ncbi:phage tail spike protein [uncultured Bifidobacterium sp.]|uniref:phage tail spike protein n=1 Tax=uncultured Bifidobacterium sp. TaxID=165187 RepID=UPI002586B1EA|nr:phage tail spike protein [uncultured Bifidobacterium sp.]
MRFTVFDRWGNPIGDIPDVLKADRTRATDATDTLDITAIGEVNKDERIVFKDTMGRWAEYICQSNDTQRATGIPVTTAYCSNSISELSRTYIEDKRNRNANAAACLSKALEGTRWRPGTVETGTTTTNTDLAFYHCSVLEAIQSIADTYGLEIETEIQPDPTHTRIATRIVHMVEHRGRKTATHRFEYGKDLVDITREVDATDVVTRLYGWGKGVQTTDADGETTGGYGRKLDFADVNDGKKYVEDTNATQNWGIPGPNGEKLPSTDDVEFGDCDDPAELLRLTKAELAKRTQPIVSYTANVAALGKAGLDPEGVDIGDDIQIVDTSFPTPLRLEGRILKIEEDIVGDLADTTITLGNISQSYTQRLNAQQQALDKLVSNSGAWDSAASGSGPYMRDLIDRINQIMNETGGYAYLVPGQGIYVYDKPKDQNPTQAIQIGGGYWRIADKKKSDGDWDWRSLANGHGIFADTIFTGRLSDAAGLNFWNLDTGEFSLSSRTTVGGQTVDSIAQNKADAALTSAKNDSTTKANNALTSAKTYADTGDNATLAAAKTYASNQAQSAVDNLDRELTQLEIFNRLTNNGRTQGIYLSGGLLYINATYLRTGIISGGSSYWNLDTGAFTTYNMRANNITATGTFSCGQTSNRTELNSTGQLAGYNNSTKIGYIDYSSTSTDVDNPSIINRGLQLQAQGIVRISSPRTSIAASSSVGATAAYGWTGNARQQIVSSITDNGNGTIRWHYGTMTIKVVNGLVTNITTFT